MTTRRWASPPAAPGRRSSAISARWMSTSRPRPSPLSVSATCRATCLATACCCHRIKLIAAFDHRDIFIDPDPDPSMSFAERKRLFDLGRSSWQDYDTIEALQGRHDHPAVLKSVTCRARRSLCIGLEPASRRRRTHDGDPEMEADLLWFGGIGTYIKDAGENQADVGDRANDAIRINARRCAPR
jgi:NAD-specific glutamate dehydrogenase